uniref:metal ABC transporter solute-binding protein, Zn/Mn family n=1 Tax=Caviibacter abscessus TaxID=1766719 RepID=UPI0012E3A58D
ASKLGEIDPANKAFYIKNARAYDKKLRELKREALEKVKGKVHKVKIATTNAGYDYLLAEFGLTVSSVVEPEHGKNPSAGDLKVIVEKIKNKNISKLFDEDTGNHRNAQIIQNETGIKIPYLSHATKAKYTKDAFEKFMKQNLESVANSIK